MVTPPTAHQQALCLPAGMYNQVESKSQMNVFADASPAALKHLLYP